MIECKLCIEKKHKIYWDELTPKQMEESGTQYYRCFNCNHAPLIWNNAVGDSSCESCGEWQEGREK